jgi:CRISPR-associated protein Csd2
MSDIINNRYEFLYLFDVSDGNPNGDPDFDNAPRFDPETFQGLVSDVCLKRKIRDWVLAAGELEPDRLGQGYDIFVQSGQSLESKQCKPYEEVGELKGKNKGNDSKKSDIEKAREWMCANFFDVRAFGAVMSTTDCRCGQVRGPAQLTFARSFDRVLASNHALTRVAYTTEAKADKTTAQTEMGHKHTVAYGLYAAHGFLSPALAKQTGFTEKDLAVLWDALAGMFDLDHSAARGLMAARNLFVFKHDSPLGNAPAHKLFDLVTVQRDQGVETPRSYNDYQVSTLDEIRENLPQGVAVEDRIGG